MFWKLSTFILNNFNDFHILIYIFKYIRLLIGMNRQNQL